MENRGKGEMTTKAPCPNTDRVPPNREMGGGRKYLLGGLLVTKEGVWHGEAPRFDAGVLLGWKGTSCQGRGKKNTNSAVVQTGTPSPRKKGFGTVASRKREIHRGSSREMGVRA